MSCINYPFLGSPYERLDGVATKNDAYNIIKCSNDETRTRYLENLRNIILEAGKQGNGKLLAHYSVGWDWGLCNGSINNVTWNGRTQSVNHHMIDIFDSIDIQVQYLLFIYLGLMIEMN